MSVLLDLPLEVIVLIFSGLQSIDDVNRLSRCCQKLYLILQNEATYLIVMRAIIVSLDIRSKLRRDDF